MNTRMNSLTFSCIYDLYANTVDRFCDIETALLFGNKAYLNMMCVYS